MTASDNQQPVDHEQLALFPETVGTGLHTDPSNRMHRRNLVNKIVVDNPRYRGRDRKIASSLNTSRIPLQHLGDVASNGTIAFTANLNALSRGQEVAGVYMPKETPSGGNPNRIAIHPGHESSRFTVSHEFGHAYHDHLSTQFSNKGSGIADGIANDIGTIEGIADGYADRYSGEKDTAKKGYGPNMLLIGGLNHFRAYGRNRVNTRDTGSVPHLTADHTRNTFEPDPHFNGEQLKLDL